MDLALVEALEDAASFFDAAAVDSDALDGAIDATAGDDVVHHSVTHHQHAEDQDLLSDPFAAANLPPTSDPNASPQSPSYPQSPTHSRPLAFNDSTFPTSVRDPCSPLQENRPHPSVPHYSINNPSLHDPSVPVRSQGMHPDDFFDVDSDHHLDISHSGSGTDILLPNVMTDLASVPCQNASSNAASPAAARSAAKDKLAQRKQRNKESARRYREKQVARRRHLEHYTRTLCEQNRELETLHDRLLSLTCERSFAMEGRVHGGHHGPPHGGAQGGTPMRSLYTYRTYPNYPPNHGAHATPPYQPVLSSLEHNSSNVRHVAPPSTGSPHNLHHPTYLSTMPAAPSPDALHSTLTSPPQRTTAVRMQAQIPHQLSCTSQPGHYARTMYLHGSADSFCPRTSAPAVALPSASMEQRHLAMPGRL